MDNKFNDIIRKKLENFEAKPPKSSFAAIQAIMNKNNSKKVAFVLLPWMKYASAASVAFLLGMGAMNYFTPQQQENLVAQNNPDKEIIINQNSMEDCIENTSVSENNTFNLKEKNTETSLVSTTNSTTNKNDNTYENDAFDSDASQQKVVINSKELYASNELIQKNSLKTYSLFQLEEQESSSYEIAKVEEIPTFTRSMSPTNGIGYKGFWFGPQISFESKFIANNAFLGNGFGLDLGNDFSSKFGIQTGFRYASLIKQFDVVNDEGQMQKESVNYSAFTIPFSLRLKKTYFANNIKRPVSFNTYFGGDYSYLGNLEKNQIGGHIGAEVDVFLKSDLMLTLGVRTGVNSLLKYNPSQDYLNSGYDKVNYTIGVYSAIRFIVPNKKK